MCIWENNCRIVERDINREEAEISLAKCSS